MLLALIASALMIVGSIVATARWLRGQLREAIDERIAPVKRDVRQIKAEVFPNGGSSLRDRVDYLYEAHRATEDD